MTDDYLSDREQAEALRNWWRENWAWLLGGVALGIALLAGWWYWQGYKARQAEQAAAIHANVQSAVTSQDADAAGKALNDLALNYDASPYAQQARMLVAKMHIDAGKLDEAAALLRAAADKSKDVELRRLAQLRLARLLIEQKKYDDALALLKTEDDSGFAGRVHEIRGDALYAKGDQTGARAEYAAALASSDAAIDRPTLELKLQDVGGAAEAAKGQP